MKRNNPELNKWKIEYSKWFMDMFTAFLRYICIPLVCTTAIYQHNLAPNVSTDTVMAVFAIYFILVMIRVLLNPPKSMTVERQSNE